MVRKGDGWENAKRLYDAQIDDLTAGGPPKVTNLDQVDDQGAIVEVTDDSVRMKPVCNEF